MFEKHEDNLLPAEYEEGGMQEYSGEGALPTAGGGDPLDSIKEITSSVCNAVTTWKQIDAQMHTMDVQFNAFIAKMDLELDKYKTSIPVVEKQLDFVNQQISKILDHVLAMDAKTESEINMKMRMMESSENYLDKLSTMMMKLI